MALPGLGEDIISGELPRMSRMARMRKMMPRGRTMALGGGALMGAYGMGRASGRSSGAVGRVIPNSSGGAGAANVGYGIYAQ